MTIAIGMIASDGIVIAADRQETFGNWKTNQGKISAAWKNIPPVLRSLLITGAGNGAYLDCVAQKLLECFSDNMQEKNGPLREALNEVHKKFYTECVLPLFQCGDHDPDYSLLIGCNTATDSRVLWTTEKLAFNTIQDYTAIGVGSATAKALLDKLYVRLPVVMAINLISYIMYEVKQTVEGCGLGTDIICSFGPAHLYWYPFDKDIRRMEEAFIALRKVERHNFHYCIASDLSQDARELANDEKEAARLHKFFKRLTRLRAEKMAPKTLPNG
jgi:hypothetical protein